MKILIACEESQAVCIEMRKRGHEAYSCDILPCSGGHPEWHIQDNVLKHLNDGWDMMIAHPPCTYTSNAGARFLYPKGVLNKDRLSKGMMGKEFFMKLLNAPIDKIVVENPISSKIFDMPKHTQQIQPFMFGMPVQKKTRLWIKGLPLLQSTNIVEPLQSCHNAHTWFSKGGKDRQKNRSKTFPEIAKAMAEQWG